MKKLIISALTLAVLQNSASAAPGSATGPTALALAAVIAQHSPAVRAFDKLQKAIVKVAADPEMIERFKQQGVEIRSSTQAEFKEFYGKEEKRWATLIKEQGLKAD